MNADLTISALSFKQGPNDASGSVRREVSRGVNLPEILTIRHQDYVDGSTKLPGIRSNVRLERYVETSAGLIVPVTASLTIAVPQDTGVASADVTAVTDRLVNLIHGTTNTSGLALADEIFISKEQ
jgi:hypothetical protein